MAHYQDKTGYDWPVNFTVKTLKKIREQVKTKEGKSFDLLNISDQSTIQNLVSDPVLLVELLWVIEQPLAKENGKSYDEFQNAHTGNVLLEAVTAVSEALADFFPSLEGLAVREAIQSLKHQREKALTELQKTLALQVQEQVTESGN